jgi:hypothetical protein
MFIIASCYFDVARRQSGKFSVPGTSFTIRPLGEFFAVSLHHKAQPLPIIPFENQRYFAYLKLKVFCCQQENAP